MKLQLNGLAGAASLHMAAGDQDTAQPILQFALAGAVTIGHAGLVRQISQLLGR